MTEAAIFILADCFGVREVGTAIGLTDSLLCYVRLCTRRILRVFADSIDPCWLSQSLLKRENNFQSIPGSRSLLRKKRSLQKPGGEPMRSLKASLSGVKLV